MSYLAVREPAPLVVREEKPFHEMNLYKGEEQTKARFIVVKITHFPESVGEAAGILKENNVKTIVLEGVPKTLLDVLDGKKTVDAHMLEFSDVKNRPEGPLSPHIPAYRAMCEALLELKEKNHDLNVVISEPYYEKETVGPKGWEKYDDRMKLQQSIEDATVKMMAALTHYKDFATGLEYAKNAARGYAIQIPVSDVMKSDAVSKAEYSGNVGILIGEEHSFEKKLEEKQSGVKISVLFANNKILETTFGKDFRNNEKIQPPLIQLAHKYMIKGDEIDRQTEDLLAARACAAAVMFAQESERLMKEGKRMTAESDYQIIKAANELSFDDCKKICIG
jgi:hypothetical protein